MLKNGKGQRTTPRRTRRSESKADLGLFYPTLIFSVAAILVGILNRQSGPLDSTVKVNVEPIQIKLQNEERMPSSKDGIGSDKSPKKLQPQSATGELMKNSFPNAEVIMQEDSDTDSSGNFTRTKILKTDLKYPFVRVIEKIKIDSASGEAQLLQHEEMAADHILVRAQEGITVEDVARIAESHGGIILKYMPYSQTYLIGFQGNSVHAVEEMVRKFSQSQNIIARSEPDYIARIAP